LSIYWPKLTNKTEKPYKKNSHVSINLSDDKHSSLMGKVMFLVLDESETAWWKDYTILITFDKGAEMFLVPEESEMGW